ncbi:hypothetical protein BDR04DRAFT_1101930 [Suillus decipiens]|nr:hypothetical protein BDR04DRAFT_1101930 [Suillus decipiens]
MAHAKLLRHCLQVYTLLNVFGSTTSRNTCMRFERWVTLCIRRGIEKQVYSTDRMKRSPVIIRSPGSHVTGRMIVCGIRRLCSYVSEMRRGSTKSMLSVK